MKMMVMPGDLGLACTGGRPEAGRWRKEKHKKKERKNFHAKGEEEWASCKANVNWQIADLVPEIFTTLTFFLNNKSQTHK